MHLEYVPLLRLQRDLYEIPRGMVRFEAYLRAMLNEARDDVRYPSLGVMNPMAREHVAALLDDYLALDADAEAARAVESAGAQVAGLDVAFKIALVVVDDLRGGWTNRYAMELAQPLEMKAMIERGWLSGLLWSSEAASAARAREAVLTTIFRVEHLLRHGPPRTLRERLAHEGYALAKAGCIAPSLDADDLAYTRDVLAPLLDAEDFRTGVECLGGDVAARSLGFTPRGLSPWAGRALALASASS